MHLGFVWLGFQRIPGILYSLHFMIPLFGSFFAKEYVIPENPIFLQMRIYYYPHKILKYPYIIFYKEQINIPNSNQTNPQCQIRSYKIVNRPISVLLNFCLNFYTNNWLDKIECRQHIEYVVPTTVHLIVPDQFIQKLSKHSIFQWIIFLLRNENWGCCGAFENWKIEPNRSVKNRTQKNLILIRRNRTKTK